MFQHTAKVTPAPPWSDKFAWECAQRGCFSGYRYKTFDAAEKAAAKHNEIENERDRQVHQQLYGPRHQRKDERT